MSKTASILFHSEKFNGDYYLEALDILLLNNWSADKQGIVSYMINDSYDWKESPIKDLPIVYSNIKKSVSKNLDASIDLVWEDKKTIIGFQFVTPDKLLVTIIENLVLSIDGKNIDFSFYIDKLSSVLLDKSDIEMKFNYD